MPGTWGHLARRFVMSVGARPLTDDELAGVLAVLPVRLVGPWTAQPVLDQRHGLEAAEAVRSAGGDDELVLTALVHDIGKRHAGLGVLGRSVASALLKLGVPPRGRMGDYLDHGRLGADELEALGLPMIIADFARHHHGSRPDSIEPRRWDLLQAADDEVVGRRGDGR